VLGSPPLKRNPLRVTHQPQGDRYEPERHKQVIDRARADVLNAIDLAAEAELQRMTDC